MRAVGVLMLVCLAFSGWCQPTLTTKNKKAIALYTEADNYRVRAQYSRAEVLLAEALLKDEKFVEAWHRLGLVFGAQKQYAKALDCFRKGLALTKEPRLRKSLLYDFGEASMFVGDYSSVRTGMKEYLQLETTRNAKADRAAALLRNAEFALEQKQANGYQLRTLSDTVNAFFMQYFPVLSGDQSQLIFTRRLGDSDEHDEDLVVATRVKNRWLAPKSISENINSRYNEGTCSLSADGRQLIFTSCIGREGYGNCDLFESTKTGEVWSQPRNLGPAINSAAWESQPALTADGRTLYFVSDRKGGKGRRDIWVARKDDSGKWLKAVNVGGEVNTEFDEISPFIHANAITLYFATNGRLGFGGFDLFSAELDSGKFSTPVNVGAPINNHQDQFSLYVSPDGSKAYYSQEEVQTDGQTRSRIVELVIPEDRRLKFRSNYVAGTVTDADSGIPLGSRVELVDLATGSRISGVPSDSLNGNFLMVLPRAGEYALYVTAEGYLFKSMHFTYLETVVPEPVRVSVKLEKLKMGSHLVLQNIFFAFNSYTLEKTSLPELGRVLELLQQNPSLRMEIGGHTDNTGTLAYNRELSEKRARSVYEFLVGKGIDKTRLTFKGYGDTRPVADNNTEEGRQLNRRIEFILLR